MVQIVVLASYSEPRALFQYKDCLSRYYDSHYKDKTVLKQSYLYIGNLYSGKMACIYCNGSLVSYTSNSSLF